MTHLLTRVARMRSSDDEGSALAIALVFLMIFGVYVGIVLDFSTTGQRSTVTVQDESVATYSADGALEGAINEVARTSNLGVDPGTASPPAASPCFTLPAGELGNPAPVTVQCQPRTGSGATVGGSADLPDQAVLALSTDPAEGVTLTNTADVTTEGSVLVNRRLTVPNRASVTSSGSIEAGTCAVTGSATPACTTGPVPGDPSWPAGTTYPAVVTSVPACSTPVVRLDPGTYLSRAALQRVLNCRNTVVWFSPGVYYFDFRDATRQLVAGNGDVVVGGTPSGWSPGTTAPGSVPTPSAANPDVSACDVSRQGVEFVFAGDSRLVTSSRSSVQLCSERTGSGAQHVVLRGLAASTAALPVTTPSAGAATRTAQSGTGTRWRRQARGAAVNGQVADVTVPANGSSRILRIGPFPADLVPAEATNLSVDITATEQLSGPGTVWIRVTDGGATVLPPQRLRTCPGSGCSDTSLQADTVTITDPTLSPTLVNRMYVEVQVRSGPGAATAAALDGITVDVNFSAPMLPTSGSGSTAPYVSGGGGSTALLTSSGSAANTVLALHGTVYAPLAAVDLRVTSVRYPVVDRGLVVRHLRVQSTSAAGYSGPMVSVPEPTRTPREVILVAEDGAGNRLARARVRFTDPGSPGGRATADVLEWSVD